MMCFCNVRDRINGHPGGYVRIAGKWRLEEVSYINVDPVNND